MPDFVVPWLIWASLRKNLTLLHVNNKCADPGEGFSHHEAHMISPTNRKAYPRAFDKFSMASVIEFIAKMSRIEN